MSLLFLVDMEFITWTFSASFSLENCPSLSLRSTFLCVFLFLSSFFPPSLPSIAPIFPSGAESWDNHTIWFTLSSRGPFSFYLFSLHSNSHSCSYPPWLGRHVWSTLKYTVCPWIYIYVWIIYSFVYVCVLNVHNRYCVIEITLFLFHVSTNTSVYCIVLS